VSSSATTVELAGFDSGTGTVRWARSVPELAGAQLAGAAVYEGTAYLLMRGSTDLQVAVVAAESGSVTVSRTGTCATPCVPRPSGVVVGPQVLVVADARPDGETLELTARG